MFLLPKNKKGPSVVVVGWLDAAATRAAAKFGVAIWLAAALTDRCTDPIEATQKVSGSHDCRIVDRRLDCYLFSTPAMQNVLDPKRGNAWVESPYLRSLIVGHLFLLNISVYPDNRSFTYKGALSSYDSH